MLFERAASILDGAWLHAEAWSCRAGVEALRGNHDAAIRLLQTALKAGEFNADLVTRNLALHALRGSREFEEILASLEARSTDAPG